jgi:hypothetical protein
VKRYDFEGHLIKQGSSWESLQCILLKWTEMQNSSFSSENEASNKRPQRIESDAVSLSSVPNDKTSLNAAPNSQAKVVAVNCHDSTIKMSQNPRPKEPIKSGTYSGERNSEGQRHGKGRLTYVMTGSLYYEGDFKNDLKDGYGVLTFKERTVKGVKYHGGVYEGQFRKDQKHGQGTATYDNGGFYSGKWSQGQMMGTVTYGGKNKY